LSDLTTRVAAEQTRGRGGGKPARFPALLSDERGDLSGAYVGAFPEKGARWGNTVFPHATDPQAREVASVTVVQELTGLDTAVENGAERLLSLQHPGGWWKGELE